MENVNTDIAIQPSSLEEDDLFGVLTDWFQAAKQQSNDWREQAKDDFEFAALQQWKPEDKKKLDNQGRPAITFDRTGPIIASVCGLEINSRHDTIFIPRTQQPGVVEANEVLSAASQWMADGCDAQDEQSEAFEDCCITGMGWTEQLIDHDEDPDGLYVEQKVDPLEMYWDPVARKKNLVDRRYQFRVREYTLAEARAMADQKKWGPVEDEDLNASWASPGLKDDEAYPQKTFEEKRFRDRDDGDLGQLDPKSKVWLVHAQWFEMEPYFRVAAPQQGGPAKLVNMGQDQHGLVQKFAKEQGLPPFKSVQLMRKVYKQCYIGARILGQVTPSLSRAGFTYSCITGRRNRNKGTWFGLITVMRDPQMWANKWLSQTLHILNSTAKGGILAEKGVFVDMRKAQETYAQPDAVTEVEEGSIKDGKIMPKPGQGLATGHQQLLDFAISSIRDVTGINVEILGMRDANQPGVLEYQRKQAAMTILAPMFDSLRRFRKEVGRNRLCFIQDYLSDGRLIRIADTDPNGTKIFKSIQLIRDKTAGEYEVKVDDAPTSPNQKEQTWAILQTMMQYLAPFLQNPEVVLTLLEYSPIPSELIQKLRQLAAQAQQQQAPQQQIKENLDQQAQIAKIEKDKATADHQEALAAERHTNSTLAILERTGAFRPPMPVTNQRGMMR